MISARRKKRGFFFIIDVVLAIMILVIGLAVIYASSTAKIASVQISATASDLMNLLDRVTVAQSANVRVLVTDPADQDKTILNVVAEKYARNQNALATNIIASAFNTNAANNNVIPQNYNVAVYMINGNVRTLLFQYPPSPAISEAAADTVLTDKRLVMGVLDKTTPYGPYIAEVHIWI